MLPPKKARLAFLQKLEVICDRFPEYFEEGIKFLPDVYTSEYFQKMRAWQETLLGQYPMTGSAEKISDNLNKFWRIRAKEEFARLDDDKANASSPRNISYEVFKKDSVFLNVEEYSQKNPNIDWID